MDYRVRTRDEHLLNDGRPKRILALDGGGLRGVLSLGVLARLEVPLVASHAARARFPLCQYFDLIAGPSTGGIIAAALSQGWTVAQTHDCYLQPGRRGFERSLVRPCQADFASRKPKNCQRSCG